MQRDVEMRSSERTWVGYAVDVGASTESVDEDRTVVDRLDDALESGEQLLIQDSQAHALLTRDMVEELRAKLRAAEEAEAREASGVFRRTPENGLARPEPIVEPLSEPQAPPTLPEVPEAAPLARVESLDAVIAAVPELEASLAPNSESNFYAGFDDAHPDGVFVATYERHDEGTPVYVDVILPAGYRFRAPAVVEWVRDADNADPELPAGLGLRMGGLDHPTRRLIRAYAKQRKPIFWVG